MAGELTQIITAPLVERLRAERFPIDYSVVRVYPDGSLAHNDMDYAVVVDDFLRTNDRNGVGNCVFRALAPFGDRIYLARYPGWYARMLSEHNEAGMLVYPGMVRPVSEAESDLTRVRVTIRSHRRWTVDVAEDFFGTVQRWYNEIGSQGVFGEAGVTRVAPEFRIRGKVAGFEIDASRSGQETLNTLALAILNWGMAHRHPLYIIDFGADQAHPVFGSDVVARLG